MTRWLWALTAGSAFFGWVLTLNACLIAGGDAPFAEGLRQSAGAAFVLLSAWALLWAWFSAALGLGAGPGLRAALQGALGAGLAWAWPKAAALPLPPPHDFLARKLQILCAGTGLLALALSLFLLLAAAWRARAWERLRPRALALRLGGLAWALYLLCGTWTWHWHLTGDSPHYLLYAANIAEGHGLNLAPAYEGSTWKRVFALDRVPDRHDVLLRPGFSVSDHRPLLPALLAPAYALGGAAGALWLHCLLAALTGALLLLTVRARGGTGETAFLAWALFSFSAPWWTYSATFYVEPAAGLALILAAAAWSGALPRAWGWTAPFVLAGLGTRFLPSAGLLALLQAWRERRRPLWALAPLAALALSQVQTLAYNLWAFGSASFSPSAVFAQHGTQSAAFFSWRMLPIAGPGLLLDQAYGFLPWAPVFVLAAAGLGRWWGRRDGLGLSLAAVALPYLALFSACVFWHGDMGPARYLVGFTPLFALAAAEGWPALRSRAAWALAALSWALALLLQVLPWFCYSKLDGGAWLWKLLGRAVHLQLTLLLPSFIIVIPPSPFRAAVNALWAIAAAALAVRLFRRGGALGR